MAAGHTKRPERKLPVQQMTILALCRIGEPIAFTSIFPYLPEMIEFLGVRPEEVARWVGIAASCFPLGQTITAVFWGRFSDRCGRKPAILLGLTSTMITSLLWGFSTSLPMAIAVRALAGAGNGNAGILRTAVAEMVPWKELQPRAFSVMPLVYNIGAVFGPVIGGTLSNPMRVKPGEPLPDNASFLQRFPYALPNMLAALIFACGITIGILFLHESLATKRNQRDFGLELGQQIKRVVIKTIFRVKQGLHIGGDRSSPEREPLLKPVPMPNGGVDEENGVNSSKKVAPLPPPGFREVLHYQSILNLICYFLLAIHNISFDSLIPVFMHYPAQDHSAQNPDYQPPFKFSGGFGLESSRIGLLFTLYGVSCMLVQFLLFPPIARKYGALQCLRVCTIGMPITYLFVPFTALLPDKISQQVALFIIMMIKGVFSTFAFPCCTIMLTNSASSLRLLGTLNGIATSIGAVGRACGPTIGGTVFTIGVQKGFVIAPWWVLAAIAAIAAVPTYALVEGEGFGGDEDNVEISDDEEDEDEDEDEDENGETAPGRSAARRTGTIREAGDDHEEETGYGSLGPLLSRTTTASSAAISEHDGDRLADDSGTPRGSRRTSFNDGRLTRRRSRRMSTPIGMGIPISRRYSSNLGQSFGSAGSFT